MIENVCRNCGEVVAPGAGRCPHCGAPMQRRSWIWYVLWGLMILGLVVLLLAVAALAACLVAVMGHH